jgi:two-component system, chemotaxis family, protein-glutamate methylesterase/glutaminase
MIKVFTIDDSALVRAFLSDILSKDEDIDIVGQTVDAYFAMKKIKEVEPDIIILDIQMPKMNGLDFLKQLMEEYPTPVIMFSSLTQEGSEMTLKALELGALDYVGKPQENLTKNLYTVKNEIIEKIKSLSQVKIKEILSKRPDLLMDKESPVLEQKTATPKIEKKSKYSDKGRKSNKIIVIGASTGGTRALTRVLTTLPADIPPIVIVQHMPPVFTTRFAENVSRQCQINVVEGKDGDKLTRGIAYISPGGYHSLIKRASFGYALNVVDGPPVNHHKPSVDVLFRSSARNVKGDAIGVILTGMGNDGAIGMKEMKDAGAYNIAQNEDTCIVFGMPKEAIANNGIDVILPLDEISGHILKKIGYID